MDKTRTSDKAGERVIVVEVGADLLPQVLEGGHRAGEVDAGQMFAGGDCVAEGGPIGRQKGDHSRRQTGFLEHLVGYVVAGDGGVRRFPKHRVALKKGRN